MFRYAIRRLWLRGNAFCRRYWCVLSVQRSPGRGEQNSGADHACCLKDVDGPDNVYLRVSGGKSNGGPHIDLGGKMADNLGLDLRDHVDQRGRVKNGLLIERDALRQSTGAARREVVDDMNLCPFVEEGIRYMRSNKSSTSGYEHAHNNPRFFRTCYESTCLEACGLVMRHCRRWVGRPTG